LFVLLVYSNPAWLFFDGNDIGFAKGAAALSLVALGGSWLLHDRRVVFGGFVGALLILYFANVGLSSAWSLWPSLTFDTFTDGLKYLAIFFIAANVIDRPKRAAI